MELGTKSQIVINVNDLQESLYFYKRLGFSTLDRQDTSKEWALLTDQAVFLLLVEDDEPFIGLSYMSADMPSRALMLEEMGIEFSDVQATEESGLLQALFFDPNEVGISLVRFNPTGLPDLDLNTETRCGLFGELYIPTNDHDASVAFWQQLGYQRLQSAETPYRFSLLSDGHMIIGLHEDDKFQHPALNYFAPDMKGRLDGLRLEGFEFSEEIPDNDGTVRNAVLESPEGYAICLLQGAAADT